MGERWLRKANRGSSPGPAADPRSLAGQQGGAVASGSLCTVDKAVSMAVSASVTSGCCDAPAEWCPPASGIFSAPVLGAAPGE